MNWKRIARTTLGLAGVVIFLIILYLGGTDTIFRVVHGDPVYLLGAFLSIGGVTLTTSLRWRLLVSALTRQPALPVRLIYYYNIIGRFVSLWTPRGMGDLAARPLALRAGGGSSLGMAVYSTLLDRLFDYILLMIMTVPAVLYAGRLISLEVGVALAVIMVGSSLVVITARFGQGVHWFNTFLGRVAAWGSKLPILARLIPHSRVDQLRHLQEIQIDASILARVYLLTILQTLMATLRSYLIARALGLSMSFSLLVLAAPAAQIGQMLAFTPGALGIRELSWFAVLQAAGIPRDDLLVFLVGHRAYIYVCIIGLAAISQLIVTFWPQRARPLPPSIGAEESKT